MSNDGTTNHAQPTPDAPIYRCPDRTWCTQPAPGGEHTDFHASEVVHLDGRNPDDEHGVETGWWCWLVEDRPDAHLIVPRPGQRLVLEGRPNTDGRPDGVVDVEVDLVAASYLLAALASDGARDASWAFGRRRGRSHRAHHGGRGYVMRATAPPTSTRKRDRHLPADPLLRQIELAGGDYQLSIRVGSAEKRSLERARQYGYVTEWQADQVCARFLGLPPAELWGQTYWDLLA